MNKVRTTSKPSTKRSLASSKEGLRGIEDLDPRVTVIKETASVIPFIIKTGIICGIGFFIYKSYTNRFVKFKENNNYPVANITLAQAESRANTIDQSVGTFSGDFDAIANAISGLNYNGFVRVYNAFGNRKSTFLGSEMNLIEWLRDQLDDYQFSQISLLLNGAFF